MKMTNRNPTVVYTPVDIYNEMYKITNYNLCIKKYRGRIEALLNQL